MKIIATAVVGLAALTAAAPAFAQVASRDVNQKHRIIQGERSGELTRGEALHLQRQQNRIDRTAAIDRARNGGVLTPTERANLSARQNAASANIYDKKHNALVR